MCPELYRQRVLFGKHRAGQRQAEAAPAVGRVDDQFPAPALDRVGEAKMGIPGEVGAEPQQQVPRGRIAAVVQMQPDLLGQWADAIGPRGGGSK